MCCISTPLVFETSNTGISGVYALTDGNRRIMEDVKNYGEQQKNRQLRSETTFRIGKMQVNVDYKAEDITPSDSCKVIMNNLQTQMEDLYIILPKLNDVMGSDIRKILSIS